MDGFARGVSQIQNDPNDPPTPGEEPLGGRLRVLYLGRGHLACPGTFQGRTWLSAQVRQDSGEDHLVHRFSVDGAPMKNP